MIGRPNRWAIAVRASTEEQEVEQQEQALRAAAARLGAEVAVVVRIQGVSAYDKKAAKEVARLMLEPIEDGRADTLAVWALDRIVRLGIKEALAFLERLEKHLGGQLYSLTEPFLSTATMNPETRDLLVSLTAWLANRESARKSERVRAKRDTKVNRAAAIGQNATWGRGVLATPAQVAEVWRLREEGSPRNAQHNGHPSQGMSVRDIAGEVGLSKSQVSRILARPRPTTAAGVPMGPPGRQSGASEPTAPLPGGGLGQGERDRAKTADSAGVVAGTQPLERVEPVGVEVVAEGRGA